MIRILALAIFIVPSVSRADFALSDMIGAWAGTGVYSEALSQAKMKCKLTMLGDAKKVTMSGRCGSTLGAGNVVLDFVRQEDGQIVVHAGGDALQPASEIGELVGRFTDDQLIVTGAAGHESVKMQLILDADGSIFFATERKWLTGKSSSEITLVRR